jgi:hypothetical protein
MIPVGFEENIFIIFHSPLDLSIPFVKGAGIY